LLRGTESADDTFKEKLREEGIEDIDIYGNDKKEVQRQQYENWANQQRQWSKERATRDADVRPSPTPCPELQAPATALATPEFCAPVILNCFYLSLRCAPPLCCTFLVHESHR
jgi:hypothetical protein